MRRVGSALFGVRDEAEDLGEGTLRLRVTHVPEGADAWQGLIGVEILPGGGDGPDRALIVRVQALPGYAPAQAVAVPGGCGV
ncbi:hypothetical protein [Micromonospora sp. NBC_01796]|uniref:hypothetical protein n=1 Tax=Micromonospora sp. NBC_01796 TaxID=2975987 RepID=UPI002DD99569|nr:hypothetical protein [Micromonospora sp. NBC_01796]WSA82845.1 hypothetical protein OIE47_20605 [Micromonospora sp. NBC_01796]